MIADSQESKALVEQPAFLKGLKSLIESRGLHLQYWLMDDELVITVGAQRTDKALLAHFSRGELHDLEPYRLED